tara:strand:+ start:99 stop:509 length:411 start_codon:yes stop_codon:yes gene_type:complete
MTCFIQTQIQIYKRKFLNYDYRNCTITKLLIKYNNECVNILERVQSKVNIDILKCFYLTIISSYLETSKNIKKRSPIIYNGTSCFEIDEEYINNTIIIREIVMVCERNNIKLWIEIDCNDKLLVYKDQDEDQDEEK